jgi:hypothetical protein
MGYWVVRRSDRNRQILTIFGTDLPKLASFIHPHLHNLMSVKISFIVEVPLLSRRFKRSLSRDISQPYAFLILHIRSFVHISKINYTKLKLI